MSENPKDVLAEAIIDPIDGQKAWTTYDVVDAQLAALDAAGFEIVPKAPWQDLPLPANDNRQRHAWPADHPFGRPTT